MKNILLSLVALLATSAMAQTQMSLNMKDGSTINYFVSQIENITWKSLSPDDSGENDPDEPTVTGDATNVTENSATIIGYANNVLDNEATDLRIGIIYCTEGTPNKNNGTQKTVSRSQIGADGKYTIHLTGLSRGTTYYYRSFVYQSGIWFYGKVRSFSTVGQEINVQFQTGEATSITCFSAKVAAQMTLTATLSYSSMSYGICYGTESEPTTQQQVINKDAAGNYTTTLRALQGNTIYYYRPYAKVDGELYYGPTSSFKTKEDNVVTTGDADADGNVRSRLTIGGGAYSTLELGLCWSTTSEVPTINGWTAEANEVDDENYYTLKISSVGTVHYRAYVKIDGVAHYGAIKTTVLTFSAEAVDLGLPSGLKWATCNVGAFSPEEFGEYFAWGETEPKTTYDWSTYKWCQGSNSTMTKYCTESYYGTVDNKTTLDPEDDAAHVNWGGAWRMPTLDEQEELLIKCSWTWTTQNGVNGYKVKGPNGNTIFLPAAGFRGYGYLSGAGSYGSYWSSSLGASYSDNAYCLYFHSGNYDWYYNIRYYGLSVRPVCQPSVLVTSITIKGSSAHIKQGETLQLRAEVKPENATNKYIAWSSDDTSVAIISDDGLVTAVGSGQVIIKATAKDGSGVSATFGIIIDPSGDTGSHEYVDLGLPSGLKWATCNVGANSPEEYGDYFAWGETEPKEYYSWDTYKWCRGDEYSMTKYCTDSKYGTVDNKTTLELEDDAAHVNWGGAWRMPTRDEQDELRNKCSWTWTTQNGVEGFKVKGPNGNSIFLPAAGFRYDGYLDGAGSYGGYWSSSLGASFSDDAYCFNFNWDCQYTGSLYRFYGQSVRPVCL